MKRYVMAAVAATVLTVSPAVADSTPDCPEIGHQVLTYEDPWDLDTNDADNIGCETEPGPARALPVDPAPAKPTAKPEELAETGAWGPAEHPVRWMGATGGLLVAGAAAIAVARRREVSQ